MPCRIRSTLFPTLYFTFLASLASPPWLEAQTRGPPAGFGLGGSAGFFTLSGDDFEGTDSGAGFNAFLRYTAPSGISFTAGVQFNSHDINQVENNLGVIGVVLDPRYYFRLPGTPSLAPFLGLRAAWVRQSVEILGSDVAAKGWAFGGIGGLLFQLAPQFALETSVSFTGLWFGDFEVDGGNRPNTDTSGSALGIIAGIVISFPTRSGQAA